MNMALKKTLVAFALLVLLAAVFIFLVFPGINRGEDRISISAGVVPHHLLAEEVIRDFFEYISLQGEPDTIVLLSPDHFGAGGSEIISEPSPAIKLDHGITNLIPFIEEYFSECSIKPFLIPQNLSMEKARQFALDLDSGTSQDTLVVASVDFSHYLPPSAALFHDVKSIRTLINFEEENFENIEVDSWQALYISRLFAKLRGKESPEIIGHKVPKDFIETEKNEDNTSYFSIVFLEGDMQLSEGETFMFVGDMMFDRGVEYFANQNGILYPVSRVNRFLAGIDTVFGNLEGPIVKDPPDFPDDSLRFAFSPDVLSALSFSNFNLLSLANNHTLNMAESGLRETRGFLEEAGIDAVGHPTYCDKESFFEKGEVLFLSFNKTFPSNCSNEEITEIFREAREENPGKYLIVNFHWGNEYEGKSSRSQQNLARLLIDEGADLIIGSHPHVVQEVEEYNGKPIFYSLGNFIFDQYFSVETQQGLAVGMELYEERAVFRLFPVQITAGQPFLMEKEEAEEFLAGLAQKSSSSLSEEIKGGIIEVEVINTI